MSARRIRWISLLLLLLVPAGAVWAQEADALFRDFEPNDDMTAYLDGKVVEDTRIFLNMKAGAYLILPGSRIDQALLLNVRAKAIEGVAKDKVRVNDSGMADVLADASFDKLGSYRLDGEKALADLPFGKFHLGPKESLLGLHPASGLVGYSPSYGFKAKKYDPADEVVEKLKKETRDVVVRTYFGTWCPTCSRMVPTIISVDQSLAGSKLTFEYYGLPRSMDDPKGKAMDIKGVPTMVVLIDGKEVGRRGAEGLASPEAALAEILAGAS